MVGASCLRCREGVEELTPQRQSCGRLVFLLLGVNSMSLYSQMFFFALTYLTSYAFW